jgi:Zn-finger nucleic acid-binding protein
VSEHCLFCGGHIQGEGACEVCGARREAVDEKRVGARCPRCHEVRLIQFALGPVALQACGRCQGSFLPAAEWDNLLDTFEDSPLPTDLAIPEVVAPDEAGDAGTASPYREAAPPAGLHAHSRPDLAAPVSCPTCETPMDRLEFGGVSKVFVDVCRLHGIWLDGGELAEVLERTRRNVTPQQVLVPERHLAGSTSSPSGARERTLAELLLRRLVSATKNVVRAIREA